MSLQSIVAFGNYPPPKSLRMFNLYEYSKDLDCKRMTGDGTMLVEYQCVPGNSEISSLWSPVSHFVYVTAGHKTWLTPSGEQHAVKGEAVFCKNGACNMRNYYQSDFCALILFFNQDFIREVVLEYQLSLQEIEVASSPDFHALKVVVDDSLKLYFESVTQYLFNKTAVSEEILKLKFKELILQVLTTDSNPDLKAYFISTLNRSKENMEAVIRKNLLFNLSILDYANLCNKSLSTFKREFMAEFGTSPLKWITEEKLKYARARLLSSDDTINEIAFYAGFETTEHFIRCFKKKYGQPPLRYKNLHGQLSTCPS